MEQDKIKNPTFGIFNTDDKRDRKEGALGRPLHRLDELSKLGDKPGPRTISSYAIDEILRKL